MRPNDDDTTIQRVLRGEPTAWMALFSKYGPTIASIARTNRSMGSYRSEDDVRNVMTLVFERLRRKDYHALSTYPAWRQAHPSKAFPDWLTIVTVNIIRSYIG